MKISSLFHEIKDRPRLIPGLFAALALAAGVGCAPWVETAAFPVRPDTVEPGSLLGPFDGRVVDSVTGKPLGGALVFASWGFEVGRGLVAPAGAWVETAETDGDGNYTVPRMASVPGSRTRVMRFTLIIYKRGYVGYRSDRRFDDFGERHDFSQHMNVAKLDRFSGAMSHVKHVRFLGGGAEVKRALDRELVEASLELGQPPRTTEAPAGPLLDATVLLSLDELKAATGTAADFSVERLPDLPQTSTYDSRHFRAIGKAETFDAAIRVWKLGSAGAADARFESLLREVPNVETKNEMGDRSLRGNDGKNGQPPKILAAATEDRARGVVIELTCGVELCRDADQAAALLKRILQRDDRLGHAPEAAPVEKKPDEDSMQKPDEKPEEENPFQLRKPELHR
jgi:hypothetical protein